VQHIRKQRRRACRIFRTCQRHLVHVTPCLVILVGICLGSAGCAKPPGRQLTLAPARAVIAPASSPEAIEAGSRLYQQYCIGCHGQQGQGGLASPMDQTGHAWHHPDSVLSLMIMEGNSRPEPDVSMLEVSTPPFEAVLSPEGIRLVIAFIKTLWTPEQRQLQWERTERADLHFY
jgi:mono/diheme cytochrome c family protein